jgi:hypothetical protein
VPEASAKKDVEEPWANAGAQQEDGPTMAVASPVSSSRNRPLRDDLVVPANPARATALSPMASSLAAEHGLEAYRRADEADADDNTRTVSRDELPCSQDASIIVADDARGDEATLALAPGQIEGLGSLASALAEQLEDHEGGIPSGFQPNLEPHRFAGPPPFSSATMPAAPNVQHAHPMMTQPLGMNVQPVGGGGMWGEQPAASYPHPPRQGMHGGFDPMLPQRQGPGSGYSPASGSPAYQGGPSTMPKSSPGWNQTGPMGGPMAPMTTMSAPRPVTGASREPSRFTPQVIMLVAVGGVCLAILILGIVLFVTTKF